MKRIFLLAACCLVIFTRLHAEYKGREIPEIFPFGAPIPLTYTTVPEGRVIKRLAYEEYYCPRYKLSLWVGYVYRPTGVTSKRCNCFTEDPEWQDDQAVFPSRLDYKGIYKRMGRALLGFDKGHQAPDSSLKVYGETAQRETYYFSNMTPQDSNTNQKIWNQAEAKIRSWATPQEPVWVVTGPIFYKDKPIKYPAKKSTVAIPHAYFCIVTRNKEKPEVFSFIVDNSPGKRSWKTDGFECLTPVANIEGVTGFDFLKDMPQPLQRQLETKMPEMWE